MSPLSGGVFPWDSSALHIEEMGPELGTREGRGTLQFRPYAAVFVHSCVTTNYSFPLALDS